MKQNHRPVLTAVSVIIGLLLLFVAVSYFTGQWEFLLFSLPAALIAGLTSLLAKSIGERHEKGRA